MIAEARQAAQVVVAGFDGVTLSEAAQAALRDSGNHLVARMGLALRDDQFARMRSAPAARRSVYFDASAPARAAVNALGAMFIQGWAVQSLIDGQRLLADAAQITLRDNRVERRGARTALHTLIHETVHLCGPGQGPNVRPFHFVEELTTEMSARRISAALFADGADYVGFWHDPTEPADIYYRPITTGAVRHLVEVLGISADLAYAALEAACLQYKRRTDIPDGIHYEAAIQFVVSRTLAAAGFGLSQARYADALVRRLVGEATGFIPTDERS